MHLPLARALAIAGVAITNLALAPNAWAQAPAKPQPAAQHQTGGNEGRVPLGWKSRTDAGTDGHAGKDTLSFAQMTPGFHVTTGPSVILYAPDSTASGTYTVDGSIFLFPTKGRDTEGYGIFVGGAGLDGATPRYTYFLLRNDGKYLIKQRQGATTTVLKDWTALPAIKLQTGTQAMQNDLRVAVGTGSVVFSVNGTEAVTLPRAQVAPDGIFGLRFNHAVNAHVVKVSRGK
ncbi:MAG: hypothetical protein V4617_08240 [Gemmatimonadota bacterium]